MIENLPDIQSTQTVCDKKIKKVGVRNVIIPINIFGRRGRKINTVANVSIYTSLTPRIRGSHMSRYIEILNNVVEKEISFDIVTSLLCELKEKLQSSDSYVKFIFTYFKKKKSPITKKTAFVPYTTVFEGEQVNNQTRLFLTVEIPYTSLCPCSKEISKYGAHSQRSFATVKVELIRKIKIEELIDVVEKNASCEIYNLLKRPDEKYVTERAYDNPKFVEDVCRDIAVTLDEWLDKKIRDYYVVINHEESIHTHQATAVTTAGRWLR